MKVRIQVKPGRHATRIIENDNALIVELKSKPIDGAANAELIQVLAEYFKVPKSRVKILRGATGRHKTLEIE